MTKYLDSQGLTHLIGKVKETDSQLSGRIDAIEETIEKSEHVIAGKLATARAIKTDLASTEAASFDGSADVTPGVTGMLAVANGGTGKSAHIANSVLVGNGTNAINNVQVTDGAFYSTSSASSPKFGTLPVTQGGTGVTTEAELALKAYPVGSMYISYESTSPSTYFGGTWSSLTASSVGLSNCFVWRRTA